MKEKEELIAELVSEKQELMAGSQNRVAMNRIADIDNQISELKGEDSFRSHELQDNKMFIDEVEGSVNLGEGFGDQDYSFVSESFIDPNLDY